MVHNFSVARSKATKPIHGALRSEDWLKGHNVLVVKWELNRAKVAWLFIFLLILSPSLGVVVGWLSHRAAVGVAASAAVFAVASFLQGLVVWVQG